MTRKWAGRAVTNARAIVATWLPKPCPRCGHPVTTDHQWHIDHIPPRAQLDPEQWYNPTYWHAAHAKCNLTAGGKLGAQHTNTKRTNTPRTQAATIATHTPPRPDLIHQVSGPPCAGKSTHITQHAQPQDHILDDNTLATTHGGRDHIPNQAWEAWRLHRAQLINTWHGPGTLWITQGDPTPHSPGIHVTLLDPGPDTCHTRADQDHRPAITHQWIDTWYSKHRISSQRFGSPQKTADHVGITNGEWQGTVERVGMNGGNARVLTDSRGPDPVSTHVPRHPNGYVMPSVWSVDPAAVDYTLADRALDWMHTAACPGGDPDPWQVDLTRPLLALDDSGQIAHPLCVVRVARQAGKTWLIRRILLFLLLHGGETLGTRRIVNTHPDGVQAVQFMEAMARGCGYGRGGLPGLDAQIFGAIWHPLGVEDDAGPAWYARAMTRHALTGLPGITTAYVDEVQDAKSGPVQEGLFGTMGGARVRNRQRIASGTGEQPGGGLLRTLKRRIGAPGVFWGQWSAPSGSQAHDQTAWAYGSPTWDADRRAYLLEMATEMQPDAFARNYLLSDDDAAQPWGLVSAVAWAGAVRSAGASQVDAVAVEADRGGQPVVVTASRTADGPCVVAAAQAASFADAAALVAATGCRTILVGQSLLTDQVWRGVSAVPAKGAAADVAGRFAQLVAEGRLTHDGGHVLTAALAAWPQRGLGRAATVKAAVWAVDAASSAMRAMIW